jgi:hypothetical protein
VDYGFTGTSHRKLTADQWNAISDMLKSNYEPGGENIARHGSCINADDQFGWIAHLAGYRVHVHPPATDRLRAYSHCDVLHPEKPYKDRNRDIVDMCRYLIVGPRSDTEELRSGTWATARGAKRTGRSGGIVFPNGSVMPFSAWTPKFGWRSEGNATHQ